MTKDQAILTFADLASRGCGENVFHRIAFNEACAVLLAGIDDKRAAEAQALAQQMRGAEIQQQRLWTEIADFGGASEGDGAVAVKVPFRNDVEPAYYAYRCEAVAEGMEPLSIEDWCSVCGLKPAGSLSELEREYDSYRKARGADGDRVLTLTQFLPVWRQYRLGQRPHEWITGAIEEAELAAGIRAQAVS